MSKPYLRNLTCFIAIDATKSVTGENFVTCAFGGVEGQVTEFTISMKVACDMMAAIVSALASLVAGQAGVRDREALSHVPRTAAFGPKPGEYYHARKTMEVEK